MAAILDVIRTDTEHLFVGEKCFRVDDVAQAAFDAVKSAGSDNPGFDSPPFCFTGCPYGEAILDLGCDEVAPPSEYRAVFVPHDGVKPWRYRDPIWPHIFNVDQSEYEI